MLEWSPVVGVRFIAIALALGQVSVSLATERAPLDLCALALEGVGLTGAARRAQAFADGSTALAKHQRGEINRRDPNGLTPLQKEIVGTSKKPVMGLSGGGHLDPWATDTSLEVMNGWRMTKKVVADRAEFERTAPDARIETDGSKKTLVLEDVELQLNNGVILRRSPPEKFTGRKAYEGAYITGADGRDIVGVKTFWPEGTTEADVLAARNTMLKTNATRIKATMDPIRAEVTQLRAREASLRVQLQDGSTPAQQADLANLQTLLKQRKGQLQKGVCLCEMLPWTVQGVQKLVAVVGWYHPGQLDKANVYPAAVETCASVCPR